MARPRSTPPSTPFGVWLDLWFHDNPRVTLEAFAGDVGVSKSAVSLWISATKATQIKPGTLRKIALRTGGQLDDLERMVYGASGVKERSAEAPGLYFTEVELQAMLDRAAEKAVRMLLAEQARGRGE